jgi:hypothetical protein
VKNVNIEIESLERGIEQQRRHNEELLLILKKLEDKVRQSGKGINQLIMENPAVIQETKGQAIRDLSDVSITTTCAVCHW